MKNETLHIDYDSNWKKLIEKHPRQFIQFFLSAIYPQIDFRYRPRLAKQEISKLAASNKKKGGMVADIILEVRLKDGEMRYLFIHIEVQSTDEENFGLKMFRPFYWLMDTFGKEVTALALFVGGRLPKNHDRYEYSFGETKVSYTYPVYVVKNQDEETLKKSDNIFALAVLACKQLLATKPGKYEDRYQLRLQLIDLILENAREKNYTYEMIVSIADFVINVLILPKQLELKFEAETIKKYKTKPAMREYLPEMIALIESRNKSVFGSTYEELKEIVEKERKLKQEETRKVEAEMKKAEAEKKKAEAEKKKAEAEKKKAETEKKKSLQALVEKEQAEEIQKRTIVKLHAEMNLPISKIATLTGMNEGAIRKILSHSGIKGIK